MNGLLTGLRAWSVQRLTALLLPLLALWLAASLLCGPLPPDYIHWRAWATGGVNPLLIALFFFALLLHVWIGVRDVAFDYARPLFVRALFLGLLAAALIGLGGWVVLILARAIA